MALSPAEKLQALGGPWGQWITELQKKYVTAEGTLGTQLVKLDVKRARPFQILTGFVIMAHEHKFHTGGFQLKFLNRTDPVSFKSRAII